MSSAGLIANVAISVKCTPSRLTSFQPASGDIESVLQAVLSSDIESNVVSSGSIPIGQKDNGRAVCEDASSRYM